MPPLPSIYFPGQARTRDVHRSGIIQPTGPPADGRGPGYRGGVGRCGPRSPRRKRMRLPETSTLCPAITQGGMQSHKERAQCRLCADAPCLAIIS
jgi:hypothetical protein